MQFKDAMNQGSNPVVCATTRRASVSGVNAHLLELPREPRDFRVVVTFHHEDGSLCEAELAPAEAARLMSEILGVINQGNGRCSATAKPTRGSISRSEERRVGKECVSTCHSRWSPIDEKKKKITTET